MRATERIAVNTAATYTRSIVVAGLSLFSVRWILNALGETDYGLFSVIGSLIIFVSFLNSVLASSSARHFAYAIGDGNASSVNKLFNTSLSIHCVFPIGLILVGWPVGEYFIQNILTIPPERIEDCLQIFRIALISAFIDMVSVPFIAMYTAKQRMAELAFYGVLQAVFIFILAWILTRIDVDRLYFYAAGMVVIQVSIKVTQCTRALWLFRECRLKLKWWWDKTRFKELFGFATWTLIGKSGGILRNQGSGLLLNFYFGPAVNAAFGIANQVSMQTATLSAAMMGAISPEITRREARGQRDSMIDLSVSSCKYGTLLVMLFGIPFILETDFVIRLWLVDPPPYAAVLSQLMMGTFLVDKTSGGYLYAVNAHGKIAAYQGTVGFILVMTLPLSWILIEIGMTPAIVGVAFIIIQSICSVGRVLWVRHLFGVPVRHWLSKVIYPCIIVAAVAYFAGIAPRVLLMHGLTRLFLVSAISIITMALISWRFAFSLNEKAFIIKSLGKRMRTLKKVTKKGVESKPAIGSKVKSERLI